MQAPKNGFFYVLDRATGELLSADKYVEVNWASHVDMKTGRPVEIPGADYKDKGTYIRPGPLGGHNWQAMSFSPKTGLVYMPGAGQRPLLRTAKTIGEFKRCRAIRRKGRCRTTWGSARSSARPKRTRFRTRADCSRGIRSRASRNGRSSTARTGTAARSRPRATSCSRERPPATSSPTTRRPARSCGRPGPTTGIVAPPITYSIDGKQYVSVMAGWGGAFPKKHVSYGRLLTFAVGGTAHAAREAAAAHRDGDREQRDAAADRSRREVVCHLLRALPRRRDGPAGPAAIDARGACGTREDPRRRARRTRHAAIRGARQARDRGSYARICWTNGASSPRRDSKHPAGHWPRLCNAPGRSVVDASKG